MEVLQTVPILRSFDEAKRRSFTSTISASGLSEHYGDASPGASVFLRFNEDLK